MTEAEIWAGVDTLNRIGQSFTQRLARSGVVSDISSDKIKINRVLINIVKRVK